MSWTAPSNNGSTITSYTITPYTTGESSTAGTPVTVTGNPPVTTATVSGLTNGTAYQFSVTATNAIGTGPGSANSTQVVPAGPPLAPTGVTRDGGHRVGHRDMDRARPPGQSHHVLHRHPVRRLDAAGPGDGERLAPGHLGPHGGVDRRDELHLRSDGDQCRGHGRGLGPVVRRDTG